MCLGTWGIATHHTSESESIQVHDDGWMAMVHAPVDSVGARWWLLLSSLFAEPGRPALSVIRSYKVQRTEIGLGRTAARGWVVAWLAGPPRTAAEDPEDGNVSAHSICAHAPTSAVCRLPSAPRSWIGQAPGSWGPESPEKGGVVSSQHAAC
jgi:hypothetical protein